MIILRFCFCLTELLEVLIVIFIFTICRNKVYPEIRSPIGEDNIKQRFITTTNAVTKMDETHISTDKQGSIFSIKRIVKLKFKMNFEFNSF